MNRSNRRLTIGLLIGVFLAVITILIFSLALLGPTIGSVFSNVTNGLQNGRTPVASSNTPTPTHEISSTRLQLDDVTSVFDGEITQTAMVLTQPITATDSPADSGDEPTADSQTNTGEEPSPDVIASPDNATDVPFATAEADRGLSLIGNGSAYVFYEDAINEQERMLVELQVFFDEYYITATPTSEVTVVRAPELVRPDIDPIAERTPRAARFTESDIDLPVALIAWLDCDDQFENCGDGGVLPMRIQSPNSWRWSIIPKSGVKGVQDLRVELWTVTADNQRGQRIWTYDFQVGVDVDILANGSNLIIAVLVVVIILLMTLFGFTRWREYRRDNLKRPKVFISYRRQVSAGYGRALHDSLVAAGADVFIDIDDIHAGSFSQYIQDNIREREYFLVLLAPQTLQSKWVIQEVLYAQEHNRTIIPVLINDFDLYGDEMPPELTFLQQQNAVTLPVEHFESGVKRIKVFIGLK